MERWRWMPRDLGHERHLWVNVPSQRVALVKNGFESASYVAVIGAPKTPTPAVSAVARAVVINPWWTVPGGMIRRGEVPSGPAAARRGYVVTRNGTGWRIRQRPGPGNALGRVKIDMPNAWAIYLHDTPAKGAFASANRARSHGCIRVQGIDQLAHTLAADPEPITKALSGRATREIALGRGWPVWIVYFTLDLDRAGQLAALPDVYNRDSALVTALTGAAPRPALVLSGEQSASFPTQALTAEVPARKVTITSRREGPAVIPDRLPARPAELVPVELPPLPAPLERAPANTDQSEVEPVMEPLGEIA
jgi:murein L,D-transpeptidase YcbB/YkuD